MADAEEVALLRLELQTAEAELELKEAEVRACRPYTSCSDAGAAPRGVETLREELRSLDAEVWKLQEQCLAEADRQRALQADRRQEQLPQIQQQRLPQLRGAGANPCAAEGQTELQDSSWMGSTSSGVGMAPGCGWRQRVIALEEELKLKTELLTRLRQKELWFEHQLRRQIEVNGVPLESLLSEVLALGDLVQCSAGASRTDGPSKQQTQGNVASHSVLATTLQTAATSCGTPVDTGSYTWTAPPRSFVLGPALSGSDAWMGRALPMSGHTVPGALPSVPPSTHCEPNPLLTPGSCPAAASGGSRAAAVHVLPPANSQFA